MKAIIPVAGIGTRLRPHTLSQPKPLLHVAGKPILAYVLDPLTRLDLDEVVFVIGFKGEQIKQFIQENYVFKARFVHQESLLGLGYAIRLAMAEVNDDSVLIILGDTIVDCDLAKFVQARGYALGVRQVSDPRRFGIAEVSNGLVTGLEEKPENPKTNLALIGLYYFEESGLLRRELEKLVQSGKRTNGEIQLTDALAGMVKAGVRFVPHEVAQWYDCGKKETLLQTNRFFLEKMESSTAIGGSALIPPVYVSPLARIENSVVGPYVSVSRDTEIVRSIIRNSIVGSHVKIRNAVIDESLLGPNTLVRGGRMTLNIGDSSEVDYD